MPYESEIWPVEQNRVITLEITDARIARSVYIVKPDDRISTTKLQTNIIKECLQNTENYMVCP